MKTGTVIAFFLLLFCGPFDFMNSLPIPIKATTNGAKVVHLKVLHIISKI